MPAPEREHLRILKQGVESWNRWRQENRYLEPHLVRANLSRVNLKGAYLWRTNLSGADLTNVDLTGSILSGSSLVNTKLAGACLNKVEINNADLRGCNLIRANLTGANLSESDLGNTWLYGADLSNATLFDTNFHRAHLEDSNFAGAIIGATVFAENDLSSVKGLELVTHSGPSYISIDTLYMSGGKIPEAFLRGCGVPDDFITFIPSHFGLQQALQFYSCFISYSTKDKEFAKRLHSRMRDENLRVWFAPEDMKGGEKLYEQIERAIQLHDRLLIILSKNSMQSEWVKTELRKALKQEVQQKRRKLFPIAIVSIDAIQKWECFDSDWGKDLAVEVRDYFIPDFSNWKNYDSFEHSFAKLLKDLRQVED